MSREVLSPVAPMRHLSHLPSTPGFEFTGVRHNGEKVRLTLVGDEPQFVAGTEHGELCDNWVMYAELVGWLP